MFYTAGCALNYRDMPYSSRADAAPDIKKGRYCIIVLVKACRRRVPITVVARGGRGAFAGVSNWVLHGF
jgi:hypothetical protein